MAASTSTNTINSSLPQIDGVNLKEHFDEFSLEYDAIIKRAFPDYQEVFDTMFYFCDIKTEIPQILELGVGTGNLTMRALQSFLKADLTLLDLSGDMLKQTEAKLQKRGITQYHLVETGFMQADFQENQFDLIITSLALHHLRDEEKKAIYPKIFKWLKPGGQFRCTDGVFTLPKETAHTKVWQARIDEIKPMGVTTEEIDMWKAHESEYDHFASLADHFAWLKEAGFENIDCYWKRHLLAVFGGNKPH